MAATLSQRLWKPINAGSGHLSESAGCDVLTVPGYHSPPHLHPWALLLLWGPRISVCSQPLFLFDLIPSHTSVKVTSLTFPLLSVALLFPIAPALPADPLQAGRHGELPNSFSCKSSHKVITDFLCCIIVPICHFYTLVVSIPTDFLAAFVALVYLKSLLSAARASLARQFTDLIFSPVSFLFNCDLTCFMGFFVLRPLWAFSVGFGDFFDRLL